MRKTVHKLEEGQREMERGNLGLHAQYRVQQRSRFQDPKIHDLSWNQVSILNPLHHQCTLEPFNFHYPIELSSVWNNFISALMNWDLQIHLQIKTLKIWDAHVHSCCLYLTRVVNMWDCFQWWPRAHLWRFAKMPLDSWNTSIGFCSRCLKSVW